ncbi:MAG: response regulator, partial [Anaerolineales bacterium]|nr:response regulator [Anaerolineales bacterium]
MRSTVVGLLVDEGYEVLGAASYEEAVDLLNNVRFHVAILDIRLDESDVDNEAGLRLMHHIRQFDPTIAPIILTGYAEVRMVQEALRPSKSGQSPAFSFLEKNEIRLLPQVVEQAFSQVIRINRQLIIEDNGQIVTTLAKRLRFQGKNKPEIEALAEEIDELLRKLFYDCERIVINVPQLGYSAAAVFKAIPWYRDRVQGEALIVKIGERGIADEEVERYKEFVAGKVGGHRV